MAFWLSAYWGPFWSPKACLATWGQIHPHFHMHIGKNDQFRSMGFPGTNVGLGVDGSHHTAGDLQNNPGTPGIDFPLAAAGSKCSCLVLFIHAYAQVYVCTHVRTHVCTYVYTHVHTHDCPHVYTHVHASSSQVGAWRFETPEQIFGMLGLTVYWHATCASIPVLWNVPSVTSI